MKIVDAKSAVQDQALLLGWTSVTALITIQQERIKKIILWMKAFCSLTSGCFTLFLLHNPTLQELYLFEWTHSVGWKLVQVTVWGHVTEVNMQWIGVHRHNYKKLHCKTECLKSILHVLSTSESFHFITMKYLSFTKYNFQTMVPRIHLSSLLDVL